MKNRGIFSIGAGACALAGIASLVKISHIVGSTASFFSLAAVAVPLSGALGGITLCLPVVALRMALRMVTLGVSPLAAGLYFLPQLTAGLAWSVERRRVMQFVMQAGIPVLCMLLFVLHPVGAQAYSYALLWLIPAGLACLSNRSFAVQALINTFVAHAVGSVIYLYTGLVSDGATWCALIPRVLIERGLFASLMTAVYYVAGCVNALQPLYLPGMTLVPPFTLSEVEGPARHSLSDGGSEVEWSARHPSIRLLVILVITQDEYDPIVLSLVEGPAPDRPERSRRKRSRRELVEGPVLSLVERQIC